MIRSRLLASAYVLCTAVSLLATTACENYPFFLSGGEVGTDGGTVVGGSFALGQAFADNLIQERTFASGTSVTTVTYTASDIARTPRQIDFNADGKTDPVVGYGADQAVIQILLSQGAAGTVDFLSLTLDSKRDMLELADVAAGDIDTDGALDIVAAADAAVWYFHHPSGQAPTELRAWGNPDPTDPLRERIDASMADPNDPNQNIAAIIAQAAGPAVNIDDYIITVENRFTNVEIADFNLDGDNDIAATRTFKIHMEPRPDHPVDPIEVVDGDVLVFLNPRFATTGHGWTKLSVGRHERQQRLDRDTASGLLVQDMDGDGDLDLVTSARDDNNVQVAWFENPGPPLVPGAVWTQWRIGSVRDAFAVDVADLTDDGRPDVVATGGAQMQMMLFEQPSSGPKRSYDWDTHVIVTFESFEPRDVKAVDVDNDGELELVVGGTDGALRYFERPGDPRTTWTAFVIKDFESLGEVGLLGWGDLDGDGDSDLVAVLNPAEPNQAQLVWIRNDLNLLQAIGGQLVGQ